MARDWFELPQDIPGSLLELIHSGSGGWTIRHGYSLELDHSLWGFFPALYAGTEHVVISQDKSVIEEVWKHLSPRRSKLDVSLYYVNDQLGIGYHIEGIDEQSLRKAEPFRFLTRERLTELLADSNSGFRWAPGLVGDDMSPEEFLETIRAALKKRP